MAATFVRQDVWTLAPNDPVVTFYGDAVQAMKAKPAQDPTSWDYQAAIHGTHAPQPPPLSNECRHQSWFFVSWHRAYLYYFERLVRAEVIRLGGPKTWALPYWNYDGGSGHNALPVAFRNPKRSDGTSNPLYVQGRSLTGGAGLPAAITSAQFAMSRTQFIGGGEFGGGASSPLNMFAGATGRLEQTPHNDIHVAIGGLMGDPGTAAEDPIFWLHHCNIDRLWWAWQKKHSNPNASSWKKPKFTFFDVGGKTVTKSSADVEDTVKQLHYTFKVPARAAAVAAKPIKRSAPAAWPSPWPKPAAGAKERRAVTSKKEPVREMVGATAQPVRLTGAPVRVKVPIDQRTASAIGRTVPESMREHRAFVELENVDAARNPGTVYGVYVNLPDSPTDEDLTEHHVGNVSLFGVERAKAPRADAHAPALRFSMEITDVLNRLAANKQWQQGDHIDVTFRPLTLEPDPEQPRRALPAVEHASTPIEIGRVSIHYQ